MPRKRKPPRPGTKRHRLWQSLSRAQSKPDGWIYVFVLSEQPSIVKVGRTGRLNPGHRFRELTEIHAFDGRFPGPFSMWAAPSDMIRRHEQIAHGLLVERRIWDATEAFEVSLEEAKNAVAKATGKEPVQVRFCQFPDPCPAPGRPPSDSDDGPFFIVLRSHARA